MSTNPEIEPELDPRFVFDFELIDEDARLSNYHDLEPLCRGPEPRPDWVVLDRAAVDTELGILKTGKEAEVNLVERSGADGAESAGRQHQKIAAGGFGACRIGRVRHDPVPCSAAGLAG